MFLSTELILFRAGMKSLVTFQKLIRRLFKFGLYHFLVSYFILTV